MENEQGNDEQNFGNKSEAGRKGGEAVVEKYGEEHMAEIGRKGGEASGGNTENLQQGSSSSGGQQSAGSQLEEEEQ